MRTIQEGAPITAALPRGSHAVAVPACPFILSCPLACSALPLPLLSGWPFAGDHPSEPASSHPPPPPSLPAHASSPRRNAEHRNGVLLRTMPLRPRARRGASPVCCQSTGAGPDAGPGQPRPGIALRSPRESPGSVRECLRSLTPDALLGPMFARPKGPRPGCLVESHPWPTGDAGAQAGSAQALRQTSPGIYLPSGNDPIRDSGLPPLGCVECLPLRPDPVRVSGPGMRPSCPASNSPGRCGIPSGFSSLRARCRCTVLSLWPGACGGVPRRCLRGRWQSRHRRRMWWPLQPAPMWMAPQGARRRRFKIPPHSSRTSPRSSSQWPAQAGPSGPVPGTPRSEWRPHKDPGSPSRALRG